MQEKFEVASIMTESSSNIISVIYTLLRYYSTISNSEIKQTKREKTIIIFRKEEAE